jgi:hypothetical protein
MIGFSTMGKKSQSQWNSCLHIPNFQICPRGQSGAAGMQPLEGWPGSAMQQRCNNNQTDCGAKRILDQQPNFQAQKSLVQETIKGMGYICMFLPKYHCEINFIEYFWGTVKHYLQEHCDYSFATLKLNIPKALASVPVELIRKWMQTWTTHPPKWRKCM